MNNLKDPDAFGSFSFLPLSGLVLCQGVDVSLFFSKLEGTWAGLRERTVSYITLLDRKDY